MCQKANTISTDYYTNSSMRQVGRSRSIRTSNIQDCHALLQEMLKELFPSWEAVQRYKEVVIFVVGLMKDSRTTCTASSMRCRLRII